MSANLLFARCLTSHARTKIISNRCVRSAKPFFASLDFLTVLQNVVTVELRSLPFFAQIFLARTNEDSTQALYGMSLWWKENWWTESWIEPWCWKSEGAREGVSREDEEMFRRLTLMEPARRAVPKERKSWHTPTESCESDETEDEGTAPFRAPPGLPDPLIDETRGCQTDVTAKAENRLHPRYKQMKDARLFEGIITDKNSSELSGQKRLSILSWNAGPKRGEVTSSMVASFHVIMVQEAETHNHEIITGDDQQFHINQGAGQLVLYNKSTFEPEGVKIQKRIQGTWT